MFLNVFLTDHVWYCGLQMFCIFSFFLLFSSVAMCFYDFWIGCVCQIPELCWILHSCPRPTLSGSWTRCVRFEGQHWRLDRCWAFRVGQSNIFCLTCMLFLHCIMTPWNWCCIDLDLFSVWSRQHLVLLWSQHEQEVKLSVAATINTVLIIYN